MPVYDFYCEKCGITEEFITHVGVKKIHSCGNEMRRLFSTPKIIMKPTGKDMALDSLNSRDTAHIKPEYKQAALKGIEAPPKTLF